MERRRQRQQRVWFPARKRTPRRASSSNGPSSLGLGISIACLFLEASRAKSIFSFSSYVRSSFDPASMSRRTFSTSEAVRRFGHRDPTFRFYRLGAISIRGDLSRPRVSSRVSARTSTNTYDESRSLRPLLPCLPFCGRCVNADAISTLL